MDNQNPVILEELSILYHLDGFFFFKYVSFLKLNIISLVTGHFPV